MWFNSLQATYPVQVGKDLQWPQLAAKLSQESGSIGGDYYPDSGG